MGISRTASHPPPPAACVCTSTSTSTSYIYIVQISKEMRRLCAQFDFLPRVFNPYKRTSERREHRAGYRASCPHQKSVHHTHPAFFSSARAALAGISPQTPRSSSRTWSTVGMKGSSVSSTSPRDAGAKTEAAWRSQVARSHDTGNRSTTPRDHGKTSTITPLVHASCMHQMDLVVDEVLGTRKLFWQHTVF